MWTFWLFIGGNLTIPQKITCINRLTCSLSTRYKIFGGNGVIIYSEFIGFWNVVFGVEVETEKWQMKSKTWLNSSMGGGETRTAAVLTVKPLSLSFSCLTLSPLNTWKYTQKAPGHVPLSFFYHQKNNRKWHFTCAVEPLLKDMHPWSKDTSVLRVLSYYSTCTQKNLRALPTQKCRIFSTAAVEKMRNNYLPYKGLWGVSTVNVSVLECGLAPQFISLSVHVNLLGFHFYQEIIICLSCRQYGGERIGCRVQFPAHYALRHFFLVSTLLGFFVYQEFC